MTKNRKIGKKVMDLERLVPLLPDVQVGRDEPVKAVWLTRKMALESMERVRVKTMTDIRDSFVVGSVSWNFINDQINACE